MSEIDDLKQKLADTEKRLSDVMAEGGSYRRLQVGWDAELEAHKETKAAHEKAIADLKAAHQAALQKAGDMLKAEQEGRKADKVQLDAQLKAVADKAAADTQAITQMPKTRPKPSRPRQRPSPNCRSSITTRHWPRCRPMPRQRQLRRSGQNCWHRGTARIADHGSIDVAKGSAGFIKRIFIQDSSKTDGSGLAGLTASSSGLSACRMRDDDGNAGATAISLSAGTLGTWSSGGFTEKDATKAPGWYEFGVPTASLLTGSRSVSFELKGATNMAPCVFEFELTGPDNQTVVQPANMTQILGTAVSTPATAGILDVNVKNYQGFASIAYNVNGDYVPGVCMIGVLGSHGCRRRPHRIDSGRSIEPSYHL